MKTVATITAEIAANEAVISHYEWLLAHKPAGAVLFEEAVLRTELSTRKYQTRGNLEVDLRAAQIAEMARAA